MHMQGSILSRLYNAHRHTAGREELEKVAEIFVRTFMEKIATRYIGGRSVMGSDPSVKDGHLR